MAIRYAVKTGVWSDTATWDGGTLPTANDDVYSNTFSVTIDTSPTVLSISNAATTGVAAGGGFAMSANGITLTANINGSYGVCLTVSVGSGNTVNIVGNVTAGTNLGNSHGLNHTGAGTLNITGNVNASTSGHGVVNGGTGTTNITGTCTGGSTTSRSGATNNSTGTLNITGSVVGGSDSTSPGATNAGTLTHVGTAQASAACPAIGAGAVGQITILSGPLISTSTDQGSAAASGVNPCVALRWFPQDTALGTFEYRMRGQTVSGGIRPARQFFFPDAYSATYPAASNVRSGTTYGPGSIYTGTCAIPGASSVLDGVPVDATTGTNPSTFTAAELRSALGLSSNNLDSQLSTLATNTAPATIATAVRTELSPELARAANVATTQQLADIVDGAV